MAYNVKNCNFTDLELQITAGIDDQCLLFKSESTTKTGATATELGELDVKVLNEREASEIGQPGHMAPDVCLTLEPLQDYVCFVKTFARLLESVEISASGNGVFRLDYSGLNLQAELVNVKLKRPLLGKIIIIIKKTMLLIPCFRYRSAASRRYGPVI